MMDPIALTMIEKYGGDFGRERLFSMFGMAIFSPITGILIDYYSRQLGYTDYSAAFYTYDILLIISSITVFLMPLGDKLPADNVFRDLWNLLKMPHVICFILFLFVLGNFWGFIESFLFLYLKELGAPNYLLGITITVGTVSSIPFLYTAEKITRLFGHVNLIVIAFFSHACRLVGYSFIENSWWCFPFEAMEALSCHLMWVAAATYCSLLAPKNLLATLIGGKFMNNIRNNLIYLNFNTLSLNSTWNGSFFSRKRKRFFCRWIFDRRSWYKRCIQIYGVQVLLKELHLSFLT